MGLLDKLRGKRAPASRSGADIVGNSGECPHTTLTARWDSVQDMGDQSKAIAFVCGACRQQFTPTEAEEVRRKLRERVEHI